MLEKDFTELDNDFITLYSRLFCTYPFEEVKKDLNFLARLGQLDAVAMHYELKEDKKEDDEYLDSLVDKEMTISDIGSYNWAYAKLMKSESDLRLGKNEDLGELIKMYNDTIESIYAIKIEIINSPSFNIKDREILIKRLKELEKQKKYFEKKLQNSEFVNQINDFFWNGEKLIDENNNNLILEVKQLIYSYRLNKAYKSFCEFKFDLEICKKVGVKLKTAYKNSPDEPVIIFAYLQYINEFGNILQKKLLTRKIYEKLASRRLSDTFIHALINRSNEIHNFSNN